MSSFAGDIYDPSIVGTSAHFYSIFIFSFIQRRKQFSKNCRRNTGAKYFSSIPLVNIFLVSQCLAPVASLLMTHWFPVSKYFQMRQHLNIRPCRSLTISSPDMGISRDLNMGIDMEILRALNTCLQVIDHKLLGHGNIQRFEYRHVGH